MLPSCNRGLQSLNRYIMWRRRGVQLCRDLEVPELHDSGDVALDCVVHEAQLRLWLVVSPSGASVRRIIPISASCFLLFPCLFEPSGPSPNFRFLSAARQLPLRGARSATCVFTKSGSLPSSTQSNSRYSPPGWKSIVSHHACKYQLD